MAAKQYKRLQFGAPQRLNIQVAATSLLIQSALMLRD